MSNKKNTSVEELFGRIMKAKNFARLKQLAEYLDEPQQNISAWKRRGTTSCVEKILHRAKDLSENYLLTGQGPMFTNSISGGLPALTGTSSANTMSRDPLSSPNPPGSSRIPLISWVRAGNWTEVEDNYYPGDGEEWIDAPAGTSKGTFALRVIGNSMETEFREGEIIVVDPEAACYNGAFVIAKINHFEATFKQLIIDGQSTYLRPLNSEYRMMDVTGEKGLTIVGKVIEKRKRY